MEQTAAVKYHQHSNNLSNGSKKKTGILDWFYNDIAIDLGTANILVSSKRQGVVLSEPSIVALNGRGLPVSFGREAWQIHEKTHSNIRTLRPLRNGVIADFEATEYMIRKMIENVESKWYGSTRQMVICVPTDITEVERQAVRNSAEHAGAKQIYLIDEPMAAAIGLGLNVQGPTGHMIVDIGGGTTDIAVISLSGIVQAQSLRLAGNKLTEDIIDYVRRNFNLMIGEKTAEKIKCEIGSAAELDEVLEMNVQGRDLVKGIPKCLRVSSRDVRKALSQTVNSIVEGIRKSLEQTPPEFSSDIIDRGIMLAGGGALLKNLDKRITELTGLPVHVAEDPLTAVIQGTREVLDNLDYYKAVVS